MSIAPTAPSVRSGETNGTSRDGPARVSQAVEQCDTDRERELLAGDGVRQTLEDCGEPRWLDAAVPLYQWAEDVIAFHAPVEVAEVDVEAEHPIEHCRDFVAQPTRRTFRCH